MNNDTQKQYMLLFRGEEWQSQQSAEELQATMAKFGAWFEKLNARGIVKGSAPLAREGRIITRRNGRVADGPFAESKEAIGGFFLLAVDSIEEAVAIAKECPGADYGAIEVRPVAESCMASKAAQALAPALATA